MQGIKYHSPKRHKKSLKHARLLVLQRFYFLQTVKDGSILLFGVNGKEIVGKLPGDMGTVLYSSFIFNQNFN